MLSRTQLIFWMIFFLILASLPLVSEEKSRLRLAFYEYGYLYNNGRGIDKDIVDELSRRSGITFSSTVMSRSRIWADLERGDLDISVSGIQTPTRDTFAWFAPYLIVKNYALVLKSALGIDSAEAFLANKRWRFGVVSAFRHGDSYDRWLDQMRTARRVEDSVDVDSVFRKLATGRIDGMFSQAPVYMRYLKELNIETEIVIQDWFPAEKGVLHGLILSKKRFSQSQAKYWQGLIEDMKRDGTLLRIYQAYFDNAEAKRLVDF